MLDPDPNIPAGLSLTPQPLSTGISPPGHSTPTWDSCLMSQSSLCAHPLKFEHHPLQFGCTRSCGSAQQKRFCTLGLKSCPQLCPSSGARPGTSLWMEGEEKRGVVLVGTSAMSNPWGKGRNKTQCQAPLPSPKRGQKRGARLQGALWPWTTRTGQIQGAHTHRHRKI